MWLPFVTKLVGLTARGGNICVGTSFKFVLVWHRTCEKIEATQQTKYSGGWWMTLCADVKGTYEKIEATQKTDYIHRWQMT